MPISPLSSWMAFGAPVVASKAFCQRFPSRMGCVHACNILRYGCVPRKRSLRDNQRPVRHPTADIWPLRKRFQFGQDGGEIFRNRRMDMHCTLYDRIWSLCIHDVQQNVNDFIAPGSKNRSPQNLFCLRINTDLHEALCLAFFKGPAYSAHRIFRQ